MREKGNANFWKKNPKTEWNSSEYERPVGITADIPQQAEI